MGKKEDKKERQVAVHRRKVKISRWYVVTELTEPGWFTCLSSLKKMATERYSVRIIIIYSLSVKDGEGWSLTGPSHMMIV